MSEGKRTQIVQCSKCGVRNRINSHSDGLRPICGRCGTSLIHHASTCRKDTPNRQAGSRTLFSILLVALLGGVSYGILITPSLLRKDFTHLAQEEAQKTEAIRKQCEDQLAARRVALEDQLMTIDPKDLRRKAAEHYQRELAGRSSYDQRFALTPREKAQLQMQALASDSTKSFHDAIRAVAREASPEGANINVRESSRGIALDIDFDMSSMTSGEHGTHTKHQTKDSLRKEVVSLISRVTNDLFQFCRDLDLASIHVGCRHYVQTSYEYGSTRDENTMLYKIRIRKDRLPQLTSNPFLDIYATTKYFEVEEDHFDEIEIITTRT